MRYAGNSATSARLKTEIMLQAIMTAPGKIEFRQVEKPEINANQILMQTMRIGVCGSDIHVYHGLHPYTSYPIVQGHEVAGVIVELGAAVEGLAVGDKVVFTPQVTCGACYPCTNGMYHICESLKVMGFQTAGAAQEYFALDAANVLPVPDALTLDEAALIEPLAVAVHALGRGGGARGKKVLVLGAGTIGNLVAQAAKALGAEAVMITDISGYKLDKARDCGIDFMVNPNEQDLEQAILQYLGPNRADLTLECVGAQPTITQAVALARKGTTIVVVGVFGDKPKVDLGLVQDRELSLVGTLMYQKCDYERAIELATSGKLHLDKMITHYFPFQEYADAYEMIDQAQGHVMKVVITLD